MTSSVNSHCYGYSQDQHLVSATARVHKSASSLHSFLCSVIVLYYMSIPGGEIPGWVCSLKISKMTPKDT